MHTQGPFRVLTALIVAAIALVARPAAAIDDYERWYVIEMAGQRAGWAMTSQKSEAGRITSRAGMSLTIRRGATEVSIASEAEFVESETHEPLSIRVVQSLGAAPITIEGTYEPDGVHVTITGGEDKQTKVVPLPEGVWLTPAAAADFLQQRLPALPERIAMRTLELGGGVDPLSALRPAVITRTRLERTTVETGSRQSDGIRCATVSSTQPSIQVNEVLDDLGIPIRSETSLGPLTLVMTAATKEEARGRIDAPELMLRTFITPDRPIEDPRAATRVVLRVSDGTDSSPSIPETAVQRVERTPGGVTRVTIDLTTPAPAPPGAERDAALLAPSTIIASDDVNLRALVAGARGLAEGESQRAESMRRFVHRHMTRKHLGVGFAGAAEAARTRSGDCTEHAVLLAALLRADGIPARVASGLVYADEFEGQRGIFAYHMWTQALIERPGVGKMWVDLDATLPNSTPFDATHVALVVSALADGEIDDVFTSLVSGLGRLKIEVESVGH